MWLALLLAGCGDQDFDGFTTGDCDPDDATVYPGAPDLPRDGIDSDCDGSDPEYPYVDEWELLDLAAEFAGLQAVIPGTAAGTLTLDGNDGAETRLIVPVSPDVAPITLPVNVTGSTSALPGGQGFQLDVADIILERQIAFDWLCNLELADDSADDVLHCEGALLAFGINLDSTADFQRR